MLRQILFLICISSCLTSCLLEKRLYRNGYYIDSKHSACAQRISDLRRDSLYKNETSLIQQCEDHVVTPHDTIAERIIPDTAQSEVSQTMELAIVAVSADSVAQSDEEPVKEVKKGDRWKFAGFALLSAAIGILLLYLFGSTLLLPGIIFVYSAIVLGTVIYFIVRSTRSHHRFKDSDPEKGKQQPLQWLVRISLYVLALIGALYVSRYAIYFALFWG